MLYITRSWDWELCYHQVGIFFSICFQIEVYDAFLYTLFTGFDCLISLKLDSVKL